MTASLGVAARACVDRLVGSIIFQPDVFKSQNPQARGADQHQHGQVPRPLFHFEDGMQPQGQDETIGQIEGIDEIAVRNEELEQKDPGRAVEEQAGQDQIAGGLEPGLQGPPGHSGQTPQGGGGKDHTDRAGPPARPKSRKGAIHSQGLISSQKMEGTGRMA